MKTRKQFFDEIKWQDGIGFLDIEEPTVYDDSYFEKYVGYENTERGIGITKFRADLVNRYLHDYFTTPFCLDVGIGSGHFLKYLYNSTDIIGEGIDINPKAIKWLADKGFQSTQLHYEALTFWDSLEHITQPWLLWEKYLPNYIFTSIPIFENKEHIFQSKHFRPDEHRWYFTRDGFIRFMAKYNYELKESLMNETIIWNRLDIQTFIFQRKISND